jgi:hypothetical protein
LTSDQLSAWFAACEQLADDAAGMTMMAPTARAPGPMEVLGCE